MFSVKKLQHLILVLALVSFGSPYGTAQQIDSLRGLVADPTGAVIPGATVTLTSPALEKFVAIAGDDGTYQMRGVPAGVYMLNVAAKGFASYLRPGVQVSTTVPRSLDIKLQIELQQQEVVVTDSGTTLDTSSGSNASALVIKGKDLDALSDDPDELASDLEALAGPSAGPNGGQIYVDGFSGGALPPKSSIREIRVNQNPFSAQYDSLGYGRIEVLTKPGTEKFHGQASFNGNTSMLNTRWSPILRVGVTEPQQPAYHTTMENANFGGPINKQSSFQLSYNRRSMAENSIVNATILDSSFTPTPFVTYLANPRTRTEFSPRIDYQLAANNTLTFRYEFSSSSDKNDGVGLYSLPSVGYNSNSTENQIQVSDTQVFGARVVNETRFQYVHDVSSQTPLTIGQTVSVANSFATGGNSAGKQNDTQAHYEVQNYTSMALGNHAVKFGARLRERTESNTSYSGFNGTYSFNTMKAYQTTMRDIQQHPDWSAAQIRADGGGASQYYISTGTPTAKVSLFDGGLYGEDDWKFRPNLTLSYGLRFETQSQIHDRADFGPRVGIGWGIGKNKAGAPKAIVRAGFGIFYDRFGSGNIMQALRQNGVNQQAVSITNPDSFPGTPTASATVAAGSSGAVPGRYEIDPTIHASYTRQIGASLEKALSKTATLSVTYLNASGHDGYLTRNINAPMPGTYNPLDPTSGVRPDGVLENIYQYGSQGNFSQNQVITNVNLRATKGLSLFGFYVLNNVNADSSGSWSQPSQPYDLHADYGRASYDIHQRLFMGGTVQLPHGFSLSPMIVASSGSPFNITTGTDLNGDFQYSDRPAFATDLTRASVIQTKYGAFDTNPTADQTIIPINYETGPSHFTANLRVGKAFGFGPKLVVPTGGAGMGGMGGMGFGGGGGRRGGPDWGAVAVPHRYNLTMSAQAQNIFNIVNLGNPTGNLASPNFGISNTLAGQMYSSSTAIRRMALQAQFSF